MARSLSSRRAEARGSHGRDLTFERHALNERTVPGEARYKGWDSIVASRRSASTSTFIGGPGARAEVVERTRRESHPNSATEIIHLVRPHRLTPRRRQHSPRASARVDGQPELRDRCGWMLVSVVQPRHVGYDEIQARSRETGGSESTGAFGTLDWQRWRSFRGHPFADLIAITGRRRRWSPRLRTG